MKTIHFALVCLLTTASCCVAQTTPKPEDQDASQSAAQPPAATGQTPAPTPPAPPPAGQTPDPDKSNDTTGTSNDRLFFALPNFLSVEQKGGRIVPLTTKQKYAVVARGSFDPIQLAWYGTLSAISQAENSEPGFGQGWAAYGKRFGASAADGTIENFFTGAILPSVLRQDPRFFPTTTGSFFNRSGYAVSRIVVTRTDSGHNQFNYSEVVGSAISSAISTYSYHPGRTFRRFVNEGGTPVPQYWPSDRTLKNTASVWGSQVGYDALTLVVKEFWPDIRRKLKKQSH